MLLNLVSKVIQKSTSVGGVTETPVIKGSLGGLNSKLDIGLASLVDLSDLLLSRRVLNGEFLVVLGLDKLVVNEKTSWLLVSLAVRKGDGFDSRHYDVDMRRRVINEVMKGKKERRKKKGLN